MLRGYQGGAVGGVPDGVGVIVEGEGCCDPDGRVIGPIEATTLITLYHELVSYLIDPGRPEGVAGVVMYHWVTY